MYASDRQTDVRQTDVRQKHRLMPPPYGGGAIINYKGDKSCRVITPSDFYSRFL